MIEISKTTNFAKQAFYKFVVAAILSSLGITVSTFVDSVIIGNAVGEIGLAAANIVSPVFMVLNMLGFTIAIGSSIFIAQDLGEYKIESAQKRFSNAVVFGGVVSIAVYLVILVFYKDIFYFMGATETTIEACKQYGDVLLFCAPVFIMSPILSISVRSDANPNLAAISAIVVVMVNIVLDIVLMFGFSMGPRGAAIAICVAEFLGILVCVSHFFTKNSLLKLVKEKLTIKKTAGIVKNGFGLGSAYIFQSVVVIIFNNVLAAKFGVADIAIFTVLTTVFLFAYAIFDGISLSISPLVSTYFGEKDTISIRATMREALKLTITTSIILIAVINIFSKNIIMIFGLSDASTLTLAIKAMMIYSVSIFLMCINSVMISFFQSTGRIKLATMVSFFKNLVFLIVFGVILIPKFGIIGISITYILAELASFAVLWGSVLLVKSKEKIPSMLLLKEFKNDWYEIIIDSNLDEISVVAEDVEVFCEAHEIEMQKIFFVNFIIEELLVNIVKMGIKDKKTHNIKIKVMANDDEVNIWIRDDVTSYNPFDNRGDNIDNMVINMIKEKAKHYDYQRRLVFNNLYVII